MASDRKQMSNPFSMGGGGVNFEIQVQASFVAIMLAGGFAPCLPCQPIRKIKLQGRHAGYDTDDMIVFTAMEDGSEERKLLGQIKHSIRITENDPVFESVIQAAWSDFNNASILTKGKDAIGLITGPLSATDIADVRTLLEWARSSESEQEFLENVEKANFSSESKRTKLQAFRTHLDIANSNPVTDKDFVQFLRHFHLLGYDLDVRSSVMHAVLHTIIGQFSPDNAESLWTQIIQEVMYANQNAGTITPDSLPDELRDAFCNKGIQKMPEAISRKLPPRESREWNTSEFASTLIVANLLGSWNENSEADMSIARRLVDGRFDDWQLKIREALQLTDSPLSIRNGVWAVKDRGGLWQALGPSVFDSHLDSFKECALYVLKEPDPQFELDPEKRFAASIYDKLPAHSKQIRKGLAESLALLGNRPDPLRNCSHDKPSITAILTIREVFDGADWVLWGSLNDLLPLLVEASPDEFLRAVEKTLSQHLCPFNKLFAQEGSGITGQNHMTGLLWAMESLAWDEEYLVRATVALGALAERDPGGKWANRPSSSLTTIFLPWRPQTMASIDKRKVAVQTLHKESPEVAWRLLLSLLPGQVRTSCNTHKPIWRRALPDDWKDSVTQKDYREQVLIYSEMTGEIAAEDTIKLKQLVENLDHLPRPVFEKIITHIESDQIASKPEKELLEIWTALVELAARHRRFADAEWALPEEVVLKIESTAKRIEPDSPQYRYRRLFSDRDHDLYEESGNWQEQRKKLEQRRRNAIEEIIRTANSEGVVNFAESVESPIKVGFSLGSISEEEVDAVVLPYMLNAEHEKHAQIAAGFVWGRYQHKGWPWVDETIAASWSKADIGRFLTFLPFTAETWDQAQKLLDKDASEYWKTVSVNPYQAEAELLVAVDHLIEHKRPQAAITCIAKLLYDKQPVDETRAIKALLSAVSSSDPLSSMDTHDVIEIIIALQNDPKTNKEMLFQVEWAYLPLLDGFHGALPKHLESRLASDPKFFCELIRTIYRSDNSSQTDEEPTERQKALAQNAWRLLHEWRTPPGTIAADDFSGAAFKQWVESVTDSSLKSGHLKVALINIGNVLIHCPPDPDGLWLHRTVANVLNDDDFELIRRGFSTAIHNSRGADLVDPTGKPEMELASKYRLQAEEMENAGYQRIAATLRNVAKSYEREAKQIITEHKAEAEEDK